MTHLVDPDPIETDVIHVIIADCQPQVRAALKEALSCATLGPVDIEEAGTLAELSRILASGGSPDLILLDLAMPDLRGFPGLLYLRTQRSNVPVMVISTVQDPGVIARCVALGAAGVLPASADAETMREAFRMVLEGEIWTAPAIEEPMPPDAMVADTMRRLTSLTPQQLRVLTMLSQELLNKQIAYALHVSEATVKAHVSAILQKLGVDSRTQAVSAVATIEGGCFTKPGGLTKSGGSLPKAGSLTKAGNSLIKAGNDVIKACSGTSGGGFSSQALR